MLVLGLVLAGVAAAIHVYIWLLESFSWTSARARATFGTTAGEAAATRELAFNQGFYNLFLALGALAGIVLVLTGAAPQAGFGVAVASLGSMLLAAVVLLASNPKMVRAAAIQGVAPLVGLVLLILGAALSGV